MKKKLAWVREEGGKGGKRYKFIRMLNINLFVWVCTFDEFQNLLIFWLKCTCNSSNKGNDSIEDSLIFYIHTLHIPSRRRFRMFYHRLCLCVSLRRPRTYVCTSVQFVVAIVAMVAINKCVMLGIHAKTQLFATFLPSFHSFAHIFIFASLAAICCTSVRPHIRSHLMGGVVCICICIRKWVFVSVHLRLYEYAWIYVFDML